MTNKCYRPQPHKCCGYDNGNCISIENCRHKFTTPMTRADQFRQMNDEDLAYELLLFETLGHLGLKVMPYKERLVWLKQEVEASATSAD